MRTLTIEQIRDIAIRAHGTQKYGEDPYSVHLDAVVSMLGEFGFDSFEDKQCTLCADMCPVPNPLGAIAMVPDAGGGNRPEIYDGCIGCGTCQEVCPTSTPSIVVKPRVTYEQFYTNKS